LEIFHRYFGFVQRNDEGAQFLQRTKNKESEKDHREQIADNDFIAEQKIVQCKNHTSPQKMNGGALNETQTSNETNFL
jgi:hypothetical protein